MKIAICTIGSRGDIQPFLILGDYLTKRGHHVRFVSAKMYTSLAGDYQVDFESFEGDYELLMDSDEMKKVVGKNPFTIGKVLREKVYPILENSLDSFLEVSKWADVVVYHPKALIDAFGYLFPEKLIKAYVLPAFTTTRAFPSPIFSGLWIPRFLNRFSYWLTKKLMNTVKKPVANFYKKHELKGKFKFLDSTTIYGISPSFLEQPKDYPDHHSYSGFWLGTAKTSSLDESITSFLNTDKKKLIITLGSMPYKSKIDINDFLSACLKELDIKILIVRGWGLKDALIQVNENILAIDQAPFETLFPLADAVVHHGGAGTTAITLKAKVPMMICPILHPVGDQMFWGKQVHKKGLGIKPIPLKNLSTKRFVASIKELMETDFSKTTQKMHTQLQAEDGLQEAAKLIEAHYKKEVAKKPSKS
ncbi:MAG: glycosyltransferase family 1 protein [Aureispira sp.]|nr:glycosyltransferase family 1 protein [Aureispira sp.]